MEEIYQKLRNDMGIHFQAEYPIEACGLITKDFKFIPCKNISPIPKESFIIDPIALLDYEEDTWGIVHSHPGKENPIPSEQDISSTIFDEYKFIVGFASKFFIYWFDNKWKILRYEPFEVHHLITNGKDNSLFS